MKKQTILLSALALTMLASCEKEAVTLPTETKKAQITMQLGQYGETKGLGAPTTATAVAVGLNFNVESFDAITATGGTSLGTAKMAFVKTELKDNEYTATAELNTKAKSVKLIGNYDGTDVGGVMLTPNVNTRQGDMEQPVVQVSGEADILGLITDSKRTAEVAVSPEMARIEILGANTDIDGTTNAKFENIKDVKIKAIYLNNVKLNRTDTDTELSNTTGAAGFLLDYVTGGSKYALVDKHPSTPDTGWEIVDADGARVDKAFTDGNAIGYNIFPQTGGDIAITNTHPHINIELSYQERTDGVTFIPKEGFMNINAFKDLSGYVTEFAAGSVYSFSVTDITNLITDPETPISPEPEPEVGSVTITCTVASWKLVTVTPEV